MWKLVSNYFVYRKIWWQIHLKFLQYLSAAHGLISVFKAEIWQMHFRSLQNWSHQWKFCHLGSRSRGPSSLQHTARYIRRKAVCFAHLLTCRLCLAVDRSLYYGHYFFQGSFLFLPLNIPLNYFLLLLMCFEFEGPLPDFKLKDLWSFEQISECWFIMMLAEQRENLLIAEGIFPLHGIL